MNREHLVKDIVDRLVRLPSPFDSHYGVVPLPPSEEYVILEPVPKVGIWQEAKFLLLWTVLTNQPLVFSGASKDQLFSRN